MTAKPISIKGNGCKFGGCVRKAVELTSGDLPFVSESRLRVERLILTGRQKSAECVVVGKAAKAQTVPVKGLMGLRHRLHQRLSPSCPPAERLAVVKLLVDLGEDVNAADSYGITPLMIAANLGDIEIVKYLIEAARISQPTI